LEVAKACQRAVALASRGPRSLIFARPFMPGHARSGCLHIMRRPVVAGVVNWKNAWSEGLQKALLTSSLSSSGAWRGMEWPIDVLVFRSTLLGEAGDVDGGQGQIGARFGWGRRICLREDGGAFTAV